MRPSPGPYGAPLLVTGGRSRNAPILISIVLLLLIAAAVQNLDNFWLRHRSWRRSPALSILLLPFWQRRRGGGCSGSKQAVAVVKARRGLRPAAARRTFSVRIAVQGELPLGAALLLMLEGYRCCVWQYVELNQQRLKLC